MQRSLINSVMDSSIYAVSMWISMGISQFMAATAFSMPFPMLHRDGADGLQFTPGKNLRASRVELLERLLSVLGVEGPSMRLSPHGSSIIRS